MDCMVLPLTWDMGIALWVLDMLHSDQIPGLAAIGLQQGYDIAGIRRLAGAVGSDTTEAKTSFSRALEELHLVLPSRAEAGRQLAAAIASQIVNGRLEVFEAARRIAQISRAVGPGFHDLDAFIYAESEAEDRPADREFFARQIFDKACDLLR
jgi:hypothetical protein